MTIRHLKLFLAVAETGTMSRAAEKCFVSQPTVSQTIKELEQHYGVKLFDRLSKRLYITKEGQELLSYARQIISRYDRMEQAMMKSGKEGYLRLGGTLTVGNCMLSKIVGDFEKMHSEMTTYTYVGNTKQIEEMLLKSELDAGIIEGDVTSTDLKYEPIVEDFLVLVCGANHPFAKKKQIKAEDLRKQRFAMREKGSGTRALFEQYLLRHGIEIQVGWEAENPTVLLQAVKERRCLAVMSVRLLEEEVRSGNVRVFLSESSEWNRSFKFTYHKDRILTEEMCDVRKLLADYKKPEFLEETDTGVISY